MFRQKRKLSMLLTFLIVSAFIAAIPIVAAAEGDIGLYPQNVSWLVGSEPSPKSFLVQMNITNVSNFVGLVFSFHWDPTYLNLTNVQITTDCVFGTAAVPDPPGTGGTTVTPAAGNWKTITYFADGNFSQQAYGEIPTYVPLTFTAPSWGKVVTLNFTYIGSAPSMGSPVDTDIVIVDNDYVLPGGYKMATQWVKTPGPVATLFSTLGSTHFHYEAQAMALRAPVAAFTFTSGIIYVNQSVLFDASTSVGGCDGDTDPCPITQYDWDFADTNTTSTGTPIISHIYSSVGTYPVGLFVVAPGVGPFINASYLNTSSTVYHDVIISVLAHTGIDVYTEDFRWPWYYTNKTGEGSNQNASCFRPEENVDLYGYVYYNDDAVQNKLVKFYIEGPANPYGQFYFTRTAYSSNGSVWNGTHWIPMDMGVAWIPFRIPWPCDYAYYRVFGKWKVTVQVALPDVKPGEETIYEDTLYFAVCWGVTIVDLRTLNATGAEMSQFKKCETITIEITLTNCYWEPVDAVVACAVYDDVGTIIGSCHMMVTVPPETEWCNPTTLTVNCTLHIPKWAYVGPHASVYANAYTWWPWTPAYAVPWCPEVSIQQLTIQKA